MTGVSRRAYTRRPRVRGRTEGTQAMALPAGTTARQVRALARWALAGVVVVVLATGWWPSLRGWGACAGLLGVVLTLWVMAQMLRGDRSMPAHTMHLVLAVPMCVLGAHLAAGETGGGLWGQTGIRRPPVVRGRPTMAGRGTPYTLLILLIRCPASA